ncbi:hypothetical protein SAMN05216201_106127 [Pseudomonas linyingensis]|uniref:Uncharacterized protein n=1 Tax=Pseudomonas linyingensis TaxID=915471 RepID=A0A1H6XAE0_9PSED|nr:hypothetical protein SAMN05216201_106127 [Pseudomonas linyingensis]
MTTTTALPSRRRSRSRSDSQSVKPLTQRLALLLALALSLPLLYGGGCLLLAAIASYQTQAFLDDWSAKRNEPSPQAWQIAHAAAQRAVSLYPGSNGEALERLGRVLQWQQFRHPFGAAEAEQSRRAALEAFRSASQARPTWPHNWAALAYAKLYLLEFDHEFAHALQQAQALGPTRVEINRSLAEIGLIAWPSLTDEQRTATLEAARRTIRYSRKEAQNLLTIAQRTGMSEILCQDIDTATRNEQKICQ